MPVYDIMLRMKRLDPTPQDHSGEAEHAASSSGQTQTTSSGESNGVCRIIGACRAFFDSFAAPLGYEDETGFHYGDQPKNDQA